MAESTGIIMWPVYTLIIWTTCFRTSSLSCMEETTTLFGLEPNVTLFENDEMGNISMVDMGDSFRRQISQVIIPIDSQNRTEEIEALLSLSNVSLADYERDNSSNLFIMRKRKKQERIQAIKDTILLLTGRNRTFNVSSVQNEGNLEISNVTFQNINAPIDSGTIYGNQSSRDERRAYPRSVDNSYDERRQALSKLVTNWLNSYYHNSSRPDTSRERMSVEFDDIGLGDIITVPVSFEWIICSKRSTAKLEIFKKLTTSSYPLPIKRYANSVLELLEKEYRMDSNCIASGWMDMSIIYFNDEDEPRNTILEDFLPTNCFCKTYDY